jgi:cellulose synthase/poly-beta-1,6-N-acetylglucosamine synthase-like glycosyltransferase
MRLARFGYRTAVIRSTTYEEAPARFGPWLKQRTRWFKGWVQTWLVHMRSPRALAQQLGLRGFAAFQLLVGGTVLAALVHPLFAIEFMVEMAMGTNTAMLGFYLTTLVVGYAVSAALGAIGLARRGLLASAWVLVLIPVYWMLLSAAAWRAVFQLVQDPYRWEKTEHGLARTSRLAERAASGAT